MIYNDVKGVKYPRWAANEAIRARDMNAVAELTYRNLSDTMATMAEGIIGAANVARKDVQINGLEVAIATDDLTIAAGSAVSFTGSYFNATSGLFAFQAGTQDQPFWVVVPTGATISDFVTSEVISGMEIRGNIEIRPTVTLYDSQTRGIIDPTTQVVTNSSIDTKGFFGAEVRLRYGNAVAANSQAPSKAGGWVKIAELFIDNDGTQTIVDPDNWTTGAGDYLILQDAVSDFDVSDIPLADTSQAGIVERATATEFDGDDTTRYVTASQVNAAIAAARMALQTSIDNLPDSFTLGDIPDADTSTKGLVERATTSEFDAQDAVRYVTAALVHRGLAGLVDSAPSTLNTLNELADALGDDPNFATTIMNALGGKLDIADNLSDLDSVGAARTNLGLGTAAVLDEGTGANNLIQVSDADDRYVRVESTVINGASWWADLASIVPNVGDKAVVTGGFINIQGSAYALDDTDIDRIYLRVIFRITATAFAIEFYTYNTSSDVVDGGIFERAPGVNSSATSISSRVVITTGSTTMKYIRDN